MDKYALVKSDKVENIAVIKEEFVSYFRTKYDELIEVTEETEIGIGFEKVDGEWVKPEVPPTEEELRQETLEDMRNQVLSKIQGKLVPTTGTDLEDLLRKIINLLMELSKNG